jgi:hypothetical protein
MEEVAAQMPGAIMAVLVVKEATRPVVEGPPMQVFQAQPVADQEEVVVP